ncbi:MAG: kelch-like protein [Planctomycetota bacterium]|nr:MAG: kelch-like protein [Planctomycetota bacterium]
MTKSWKLPFAAACAALLASSPAFSQDNATANLMTYGDAAGSGQAILSNLTPNSTTYLLVSLGETPANYFLRDTYGTGDNDDYLSIVGPTPPFQAILNGTSTPGGQYTQPYVLPAVALDLKVYWQGFTLHPAQAGTAGMFQDFTNVRVMTINDHGRWQYTCTDFPTAGSNVASAVMETGVNGLPTKLFVSGGGPALLTDEQTPYPTNDQAWIYDAARETHTVAAGAPMTDSRAFHTCTALGDGTFLVCGGVQGPNGTGPYFSKVLNTAEVWDPVNGFQQVGNMGSYRAGHTATLIESGIHAGKVLIAGGTEGNGAHELYGVDDLLTTALKSTELYDPVTQTFSAGPWMQEPKAGASALTMANGEIIIAGGITWTTIIFIKVPDFSDSAVFYDPTSNSFTYSRNLQHKRALFGMVERSNGDVVCAGGAGGDILNIGPISSSEYFDLSSLSFVNIGQMGNNAAFPGAVVLPDDTVVILGGAQGDLDDPVPVNNVNILSPANVWTAGTPLQIEHAGGVAAYLEDGTIYMGTGETGILNTSTEKSETYTP